MTCLCSCTFSRYEYAFVSLRPDPYCQPIAAFLDALLGWHTRTRQGSCHFAHVLEVRAEVLATGLGGC